MWRVMLCVFLLGMIIAIATPALLKSGNKEIFEIAIRPFIALGGILISIGIMKQILQKYFNKINDDK